MITPTEILDDMALILRDTHTDTVTDKHTQAPAQTTVVRDFLVWFMSLFSSPPSQACSVCYEKFPDHDDVNKWN